MTPGGIPEHRLTIRIMPDGEVRSLYSEVAALHELGVARMERVTDVMWDREWQWWIPVLVSDGKPLTGHGFAHRADAVAAEVEVLNRMMLEGEL